jgi:hypothetical protein
MIIEESESFDVSIEEISTDNETIILIDEGDGAFRKKKKKSKPDHEGGGGGGDDIPMIDPKDMLPGETDGDARGRQARENEDARRKEADPEGYQPVTPSKTIDRPVDKQAQEAALEAEKEKNKTALEAEKDKNEIAEKAAQAERSQQRKIDRNRIHGMSDTDPDDFIEPTYVPQDTGEDPDLDQNWPDWTDPESIT